MYYDSRGEPVTAAKPETASLLDNAIGAHLQMRRDTAARLDQVLSYDPACVLAHCFDGYLKLLASRRDVCVGARQSLARAVAVAERNTTSARDNLHIAALRAWYGGDWWGALDRWETCLSEYPHDFLALKPAQFIASYLGESRKIHELVDSVLPNWDASAPDYGFLLGCHAYGLEEDGNYAAAERSGLRALQLNKRDLWAAHAIVHVLEMQDRPQEGIAIIAELGANWSECSKFALHVGWHDCLFHIELEQFARAFDLYDRVVRAESTNLYLDITNAISLLWRLEQLDVDVGHRWNELASHAAAHIGDHMLVFADVHYLMALAARGDEAIVQSFLASCRVFARQGGCTQASVMAEVGLPLMDAAVSHRHRDYRRAAEVLLPVRHRVRRIGGSHAQRDIFDRMLIDSARRCGDHCLADALLAERASNRPNNIWMRRSSDPRNLSGSRLRHGL